MAYTYTPKPGKSAKVIGRGLKISAKSSVTVCRAINGKHVTRGSRLLADILARKRSLNGKYYDNCVSAIADLLKNAEANAEAKGLDPSKLMIHASSHNGYTFRRPRRFKMRGQARKIANIQIVLQER
ncbi:MAG: uL22 family ribosomal protein [Candidatus Aenigmarchaeota archaeon]